MERKRNHYEVLGVSRNATDAELKSAMRNLARKYHTDNGTEPNEEEMKRVNMAYEVLSNEATRKKYDALLSSGVSQEEIDRITLLIYQAALRFKEGDRAGGFFALETLAQEPIIKQAATDAYGWLKQRLTRKPIPPKS
jgi:molecular chaperone DnaJ